jgi:hypothetical protein
LLIAGPLVLFPPPILGFLVRPRCFFLKNSLLWDLIIGSGYNKKKKKANEN